MKRILLPLVALVLIGTNVFAQEDEFDNKSNKAKPRHDLACTIGLPGILNLSYTASFTKRVGTRLTGGGLFSDGHWFGLQGELFVTLEHSKTFTADLSVGVSAVDVDSDEDDGSIAYAAIFANIRYRRFFFQIGTGPVLSGSGDFKDDGGVLPFQLGIILAKF